MEVRVSLIAFDAFYNLGATALYLDEADIRMRSVHLERGARPWVASWQARYKSIPKD